MIYKVTPEHFAFTIWLKLLLATGSLALLTLPLLVFSFIGGMRSWSWRDMGSDLVTWLLLAFWWHLRYNYSLEVNDDSIRVDGRVVRKGHVRYLQETDCRLSGPSLVLSEQGPGWVHRFGSVIVIPKRLPDYAEIKAKLLTWMANSASPVR